MATYTVIGVWVDCEPILVASVEGDHLVSTSDAYWSEGGWAIAAEGDTAEQAEAAAVEGQQQWHARHGCGADDQGDQGDEWHGSGLRFVNHANDIGDWCPWSLCGAQRRPDVPHEERRCPAGCRDSYVEPDRPE